MAQFGKDVLDKNLVLDFHGGNWFSEVHTTFTMNGKDHPLTLFMELEKHIIVTKTRIMIGIRLFLLSSLFTG